VLEARLRRPVLHLLRAITVLAAAVAGKTLLALPEVPALSSLSGSDK
jgi:hypothetical protein